VTSMALDPATAGDAGPLRDRGNAAHTVRRPSRAALTHILRPGINLAVWQRSVPAAIANWIKTGALNGTPLLSSDLDLRIPAACVPAALATALTCHDGAVQYRDCGVWWATMWRSPPGNWPALRPEGESDWHPVLGDRCQRIVVSGPALGAAGILLAFDKCLVEGNDEITTWNSAWDSLPDPFARSQLIDPARFKSKRSGAAD
jgi:Protein of unknown function (DUF1826)